jgi:plastocyanin
MRFLITSALLFIASLTWLVSTADKATASPVLVRVGIYDNFYMPRAIQIKMGTSVHWSNYGRNVHTVTAQDGSWDSGNIIPGRAYTRTFTRPGTYFYFCRHHGMTGAIVVPQPNR